MSGQKRRAVDKPEPLWRPVAEEGGGERGSASKGGKCPVSEPSVCIQSASPPSPRTMKAIQAAMSSDEEEEEEDEKDGSVSPRTLLAIQHALSEEEEEEEAAALRTRVNPPPAETQVVVSSSEEETGNDDALRNLSKAKSDVQGSAGQSLQDNLLISSDDELEEVTGQRNEPLQPGGLQQAHGSDRQRETESEDETNRDTLTPSKTRRTEKRSEPGLFLGHSLPTAGASTCVDPLTEPQELLVLPQQRNEEVVLQENKRDGVELESSEGSESEGKGLFKTR